MNARQFTSALGNVSDRYIMEAAAYQGKRSSSWPKWVATAACLGLIVTAAVVSLPVILNRPDYIVPTPGPAVTTPVVSDNPNSPSIEPLQPSKGEITINWDNVIVNESAGMGPNAARRYYDPAVYDLENWEEEEIVAYYGWNLAPSYIPDGLTSSGNGPGGFLCREKASGNIIEDHGGRSFWTDFWEDGSPKSDDDLYIPTGFSITASRQGFFRCGLLPVDDSKTTDFGGVSVTISHCSMKHGPFDPTQKAPDGLTNMPAGYYDIYVASFTLDGVEYEIEGQRLELEEVIKITASVINTPYSQDFTVGNP